MSESLVGRQQPRKGTPTGPMIIWVERFSGERLAQSASGDAAEDPADLPGAVSGPEPAVAAPKVLTDAECERLILGCGSSWKKVKKTHLSNKVTMLRLIEYRKSVVNGIIKTLNAEAGGMLIAKAIGSENLTSDYDITLSTKDGEGAEITAVRKFNVLIKARFGVPPGVCFDTNLYVKDFLDVEDKTILGTADAPIRDPKPIDPVEQFLSMDRSDQDVGALTKQRQYMREDEWAEYRDSVLAGLRGPGGKKAAEEAAIQFSEAESTYLMKAAEKVAAVFATIESSGRMDIQPAHLERMGTLEKQWKRDGDTERAHALVDEILALAQEGFEPEAMEANNELYLDKMQSARKVQAEHKAIELRIALGEPPLRADGTPYPDDGSLVIAIDALKARAKKEITDANYFASEAYLSEGPLQHIVSGVQGSKNKEKEREIYAKLRPDHLLGSINEQFGDFMKDCAHYGGDAGEAFCQTSKYIERMLNGIIELRKKPGYEGFSPVSLTIPQIERMAADIAAKLLPIRAAKGDWQDSDDPTRFAAAARFAEAIYGMSAIGDLKAKMQKLSVEVNAFARAAITASGGMRAGDKENRAFFKNREAIFA